MAEASGRGTNAAMRHERAPDYIQDTCTVVQGSICVVAVSCDLGAESPVATGRGSRNEEPCSQSLWPLQHCTDAQGHAALFMKRRRLLGLV